MSRNARGHSYGHAIQLIGADHYRLSWVVDRYYPDSRLRHPTRTTRDTDTEGAQRFAKKWGVALPKPAMEAIDSCECHRCIEEKKLGSEVDGMFIPLSSTKMILCPKCGNKRCPHASDHNLECTGSNEPGQAGSLYS